MKGVEDEEKITATCMWGDVAFPTTSDSIHSKSTTLATHLREAHIQRKTLLRVNSMAFGWIFRSFVLTLWIMFRHFLRIQVPYMLTTSRMLLPSLPSRAGSKLDFKSCIQASRLLSILSPPTPSHANLSNKSVSLASSLKIITPSSLDRSSMIDMKPLQSWDVVFT